MADNMLSNMNALTLPGVVFFCACWLHKRGNIMTEIQSDERRKRVMLYEIYGISQEDCSDVVERHIDNTRKLDNAEDKIRRARDLVKLLKAADESYDDGQELSLRTLDQLDRVESLLKSAQKEISKYENEQKIREIESWKERAAS